MKLMRFYRESGCYRMTGLEMQFRHWRARLGIVRGGNPEPVSFIRRSMGFQIYLFRIALAIMDARKIKPEGDE